ncbi:TonB-dependent receptor [Echinicola soli]|uniref:TonB-dependent receptor n=2 Tax=Echinicola soli TaxID=2591634 RepID=A0A514CJ00_9BACT|nr:TonB-dependent receptor [Echinicola soli]
MYSIILKQSILLSKRIFYAFMVQLFMIQVLMANVSNGQSKEQITFSFFAQDSRYTEVFNQIEAKTDLVFLYDDVIADSDDRFSLNRDNISLDKLLGLLERRGLRFMREGDHISVKRTFGGYAKLEITGRVTNENGEPMPGATILIKGTNVGTVSDNDGYYHISAEDAGVLIFNMLGYKNQEVTIDGRSEINVVLQEESTALDEVVVMGYNTVEKQHVASSVAEMDMKRAKMRPIYKLQEAFSGTLPGVTMLQGSNLPGSVPGTINIRGISTLQNADPLVIVDGMEQSLTDIDPNEIKSISVLKDAASAAMYGSRGANGVIIITTNRGTTGQFRVDLHSWAAMNDPIDLPTFVSAVDYMRLNNEAREHQGQTPQFTDEDIIDSGNGNSTNTDWLDEVMERRAHSYNMSANISGGGGVGTFNLMLGYLKENGLNNYEGSERFSARFNTDIHIDDKFVLLADFYARRLQVNRLHANSDGHGLYKIAWRMNPTQAIFYDSDIQDHYMLHNEMNPIASINHGGERNNLYDRSTINLRPRYHINDNLHINGNISYMINKSANKYKRETFKFFDGDGVPVTTWGNEVDSEQGVSVSQLTARANINYERNLRKERDKLYLVAGTEFMNYNYTDYREIAKASFYSKLNYSFDDRYLLEVTARGDGSSKFAPGHRWGFFPSGALAWNVHNERFLSGITQNGLVNNLKIRLSYGLIGNENVAPYLWQEVVNNWGWTMRVPNPSFSWEKQRQGNIGLDLAMFDNRFRFTAEVYKKHSFDLIYSEFPVPPLTGSHSLESAVNIGEVENKGWELSGSWSDKIGELSYTVGGILFDNNNKVLKAGYNESDTLIFKDNNEKIWYRGIALDNYYGFESNGYFQNQQEVDETSAKLPNTLPGDIRYVDQNGDGVINDKDRVDLGDPFPHMNYSITLDLRFRRWDFSFLGHGVGRRTGRLGGQEGFPVYMDGENNDLGAPRQYYMDNRWTPETPNSRFPRMWTGTTPNSELSDVWLGDASFFRIKTLQLGYTFPRIAKGVKNMRVYLNAQDAFTFTNWEGLEPERNGGTGNYPRMASYSLGVKFTIL